MGFWPAPAFTGVVAAEATAGPAAPPVETAAVPDDAPFAGVVTADMGAAAAERTGPRLEVLSEYELTGARDAAPALHWLLKMKGSCRSERSGGSNSTGSPC